MSPAPHVPKEKGLPAFWATHPTETANARKFIGRLTLDTGEMWGKSLAPWQQLAYEAILGLPGSRAADKGLIEVCGPVGAGKDPLIGASVLAALHFGPRGLVGLKQSVTRDKSMAVVKTVSDFIFRDPRVGDGLEIQRDLIRCVPCDCAIEDRATDACTHRNSLVKCGSLDGASTAGVIFDIAWLNEVQEWPEPDGKEVYFHILARRTKRKGRIACLTNAPYTPKGEWRRDRWETARSPKNPDWWYQQVRVEDCPWITKEDLEQQRRNLPTQRFKRWFFCEPSDGRGELVTKEEVQRAIVTDLTPARDPSRVGRRYLGLDVGIKRDHYALCLLCLTPQGAVFLERMECFVPPKGGEVSLTAAKEIVRWYGKTWGATIMADPHQARQLIEELTADGCACEVVDPTSKNTTEQAHSVMDLFRDNRVRLFRNAGQTQVDEEFSTSLEQQLVDAEVKEGDRGVRIVAKRTKAGHGDQASAFALAALGVARAGAYSVPVTCGTAEPDRVAEARARLSRRSIRPHAGVYLGARVVPMRRVAR